MELSYKNVEISVNFIIKLNDWSGVWRLTNIQGKKKGVLRISSKRLFEKKPCL